MFKKETRVTVRSVWWEIGRKANEKIPPGRNRNNRGRLISWEFQRNGDGINFAAAKEISVPPIYWPVDQLRGHQSDDKQSPWHVKVLKSAYRAPAFLNIGAKGVRLAVWNSAVGQPMGKLPIRTFQPTFLPSPASKDPADLICKCPDSSQMQLAECIDYANAYWILLLSTHSVCVCWLAAHSTRICYRIKLTKDRLSGISPFSLFLF